MKIYLLIFLSFFCSFIKASPLENILMSTGWVNHYIINVPKDSVFDSSFRKFTYYVGNDSPYYYFQPNGKGYMGAKEMRKTPFSWTLKEDTLCMFFPEEQTSGIYRVSTEIKNNYYTLYLKSIGRGFSYLLSGSAYSYDRMKIIENCKKEINESILKSIKKYSIENNISENNYDVTYGYITKDSIFYSIPNNGLNVFKKENANRQNSWCFLVSKEEKRTKICVIKLKKDSGIPSNTEVWLEKTMYIPKE